MHGIGFDGKCCLSAVLTAVFIKKVVFFDTFARGARWVERIHNERREILGLGG
jgi:hypothetical protein